jgi:hypothetical protein
MSVWSLDVDGIPDVTIDVKDPGPWVTALELVEGALGNDGQVTATQLDGRRADISSVIFFNAQTIVKEDEA